MLCSHDWPNDGVNYTASYTALRFRIMQDALSEQNRTILYSLCEWGKPIFSDTRGCLADSFNLYRRGSALEMGKFDRQFVAHDW